MRCHVHRLNATAFRSNNLVVKRSLRFIQTKWANNPTFPPVGGTAGAGLDPVIGQSNNANKVPIAITTTGTADPTFGFSGINAFVTPRSGEYFFIPPLSALRAGGALVTLK